MVEFFLCTQVRAGKEYVVSDSLILETLARSKFDPVLARLYFFALNLALPGERLRLDQQEAGQLQKHVLAEHIYAADGWDAAQLDKDGSLEPFVRRAAKFPSARKWVNNYWYMLQQCRYVTAPDGRVETFPDTWGLLALRLFFERYSFQYRVHDIDKLVDAAFAEKIPELLGVSKTWLGLRIEGAADMYLRRESYALDMQEESPEERKAAENGRPMPRPRPGSPAQRRVLTMDRVQRRGDNRRFLRDLYRGVCQISGVVLRLPNDDFTVDCAHIRPIGRPHDGPDDVRNMLSLSPTMHRLFDRGCVFIDPGNLSIKLLNGNDLPHLPRLVVRDDHQLSSEQIFYFNSNILK